MCSASMTTPIRGTIRRGQFAYRRVGPPVLVLAKQNPTSPSLEQRAEPEYY